MLRVLPNPQPTKTDTPTSKAWGLEFMQEPEMPRIARGAADLSFSTMPNSQVCWSSSCRRHDLTHGLHSGYMQRMLHKAMLLT